MLSKLIFHVKNESFGQVLSNKIDKMIHREKPRDLRLFRFEFGFGFESLYHPYVEAVKLNNVNQAAELLEEFQVRMGEYLSQLAVAERLNVQGWKLDDCRIKQALSTYVGSGQYHMHLGGHDALNRRAREKAAHLYAIKASVEEFGFSPGSRGFDSGVKGPMLDSRYMLVLSGQHRAAVLAGMGWTTIPARFGAHGGKYKNIPRTIDTQYPERLPLVKRGVLPASVAVNVLSRINLGFDHAKARSLSFPFA